MSSASPPAQLGRREAAAADRSRADGRPWIRLAGFALLALYGVQRWSELLAAPPKWRLLCLVALAIILAGGVPLLRRLTARQPAVISRTLTTVVVLAIVLAAFPIAGLRWHLFWHLKIAVAAREIGDGLGGLGSILVPYDGFDPHVTYVIVLGAAVLLLDAAAVLAFAPRKISDARRATAALPLIALVVVPATLVHPKTAYLQGLLLFVLLAFFVWGERLQLDEHRGALTLLAVAGVAGLIAAPLVDRDKPWFNYEHWSGVTGVAHLASFDWNQTYGPLRWPQNGDQVLSVKAKTGEYWKAQNLDEFNGTAWVQGAPAQPAAGGATIAPQPGVTLPQPSAAALRRWSQSVTVTIQGMRTTDVIAAGESLKVSRIPGGERVVAGMGTLQAKRELGPGVTYKVLSYSPSPSDAQLQVASARSYPWRALTGYLTVSIPDGGYLTPVRFAPFASAGETPRAPAVASTVGERSGAPLIRGSAYARVYALAMRLRAESADQLQYVRNVMAYLSTRAGFSYDQSTPASRYPLVEFLLQTHRGYCQQFSGAMALLLRMGGVPARIATGFTPGALDGQAHTWEVADTDAHAWDEVWFPTYGWVKFDPTPATAPARGGPPAASGLTKPVPNLPHGGARTGHHLHAGSSPASNTTRAGRHHGSGASPVLYVLGVVALLVAALVGRWVWTITRPPGSIEQQLAELERALARTGRPLRDGVTLAALEDRYRSTPEVAGYMRALRMSRYGGRTTAPDRAQRRALRRELGIGLGPLGRLRALRALPPRLHTGRPPA